jgi:hypothetical protein
MVAKLIHEYDFRAAAAATIKQTYRTYKFNKILRCWKKTVASVLLQAAQNKATQEYVTAVERQLDAEEALLSKMELQLEAEEARLESERVEATCADAEREGKDEEARIETGRKNKAQQDRLNDELRYKSVPLEEASRITKEKTMRNEAAGKRKADHEEAERKTAADKKADED